MKISILMLLSVLFLLNCRNNKLIEGEVIHVSDKPDKPLQISDICKTVKYIALKSPSNTIIGSVDKVLSFKGRYYIMDKKMKMIHVFSRDGKYLSQLDRVGNGPGEYSFPIDFIIDTLEQRVEILDLSTAKIIKTDLEWQFISERRLTRSYFGFNKLNEDRYFFYASNIINPDLFKKNESCNILLMDSSNNLIKSFLPIVYKSFVNTAALNQMVGYKEGINVVPNMENTIYYITADESVVKYNIVFDFNSASEKLFDKYKGLDENDHNAKSNERDFIFEKMGKDKLIKGIHNVLESDELLYFQYYWKNYKYVPVFYLKKKKQIVTGYPITNSENEFIGDPVAMNHDTMLTVLYPFEIVERINEIESSGDQSIKDNPEFKALKGIISKCSNLENPILAKITFKEF